ncbi:cell division protein FtsQ/DivIB [Lacticaseibacillus sp. GG6-2]
MAWFSKPDKKQDPLTPWEAYQAKHAEKAAPKRHLPLPTVAHTRQHRRRRNLALLLTPLAIVVILMLYMVSPLSKVGELSVRGENTLPAQDVISASKLGHSQVVIDLMLHRNRVEKRITKALPQVKNVTVHVHAFNQITLQVHEFASLSYIQEHGSYHVLLASGQVLKTATSSPKSTYPIFTGFTRKEAFKMARTVAKFPTAVRRGVSEVKATRGAANPYQITISMADGNLVVADSRTVGQKIRYYPKLLADVSKKGKIDLEVGAFFVPYK